VFTVHGFDDANLTADSAKLAWLRSPLWGAIQRYGLARQKTIISITPYVRKTIEPLTRAVIHDIDNPVDERFFRVVRREQPGRILCVGWINERKNTLGSVQAFARVIRNGAQATLAIAGIHKDQDYYDRVIACVREHGLANRVEFLGQIGRDRLEQELGRASIVLLPSRQENAPMAIAEAMAAGVPVVTTNRCGMPYMVHEGKSGFLVDPDDQGSIAQRLGELLRDDELRPQMGACGREIALDRFHPEKVARRTRGVYASMIECSPQRRICYEFAGSAT
jgi:glycosyltransferase involved in cell wall biosynthesis